MNGRICENKSGIGPQIMMQGDIPGVYLDHLARLKAMFLSSASICRRSADMADRKAVWKTGQIISDILHEGTVDMAG